MSKLYSSVQIGAVHLEHRIVQAPLTRLRSDQPGDVLLFGPEPDGLSEDVLADPRVTTWVRIPMLAGRRSLNLSNAAAVAVYEAWRQHDFSGSAAMQTASDR